VSFTILVDGTADVPDIPGLVKVPLYVIHEGRSYRADKLDREWFRANLRPGAFSTSMPTTADFEEALRKIDGDVLAIIVSECISGTPRALKMAVENLGISDRVYHFDSGSASVSIGAYAMLAAKLRQQGKSASEVLDILKNVRKSNGHLIAAILGDVRFTLAGGRVRTLAGSVASAIKLVVGVTTNEEGCIVPMFKTFGRKKAMRKIRQALAAKVLEFDHPQVVIGHAWVFDEAVILRDYLKGLNPGADITIVDIGPVITVHGGEKTIAGAVVGTPAL
jgi:DegV family protein with EDD domain